MNNPTQMNKELLTRMGRAIVSLILCITLTGFLSILPVPASGGFSGSGETAAKDYKSSASTSSSFRAAANSGVEIDRSGSTKLIFVRDLTDTSVGYFKTCFRNRDTQIEVFRNGTELPDSDLIGTGCTVKCVSSADPTVIYETATAVVFCDVNGDGAVNGADYNIIVDEAVMRIDSIENGSVYEMAADAKKESNVVIDGFDLSIADLVISGAKPYVGFGKSGINYNEFTTVFENTDRYIYRLGNGNTVELGKIFRVETAGDAAVVSDNVHIGAYSLDSSASVTGSGTNLTSDSTAECVYTKNSSDWTKSTLKFTGEGLVELTIYEGDGKEYSLLVEIVNANNATTAAGASSVNIVLLNDVSTSGITISNGKTLYGNGFTVTDSRTNTASTNGFITLNSGNVNNAVLIGYEPTSAVQNGTSNQGYAPSVYVAGDSSLYNCYVSGGRYAVYISGATRTYMKNTTVDGGAVGNIYLASGDLILEDCQTSKSTHGGVKGIGIQVSSATGVSLTLNGEFKQYNWMKQSELPDTYSSILNSFYSNSTYAYTYNGTKYLNAGIMFANDSGDITKAAAEAIVTDNTSNTYAFEEKSITSQRKATIYTSKASGGSPEMLSMPALEPSSQNFTVPEYSFDYTSKNYIPKQTGSNEYCYYDSTTGAINISFDKLDSPSDFEWDTDILTVTKFGQSILSSATMNGVDYTNGNIPFTHSGNFEAVYTYVDPFNYDKDGVSYNRTYTKTVKFNVTAVEPGSSVHCASFIYDGAAGNYAAKKVIGTDNKTYVMPDVTSTSSTVGATTVAGQTVYYPIVTVGPTSSNGNTAYSSGKGFYFAPVFSELHIIDYNQQTGAKQYEYSKSTNTWPRGNNASTGPNTAYFSCASGEKVWDSNSPYARSTNAQYYRYGSNNLGVCYTTNEIEANNPASNHLVQYHYVSTDGTTYYYYICYKFTAMNYSSCVAGGSLVTMADGTKKPVEQINQGDMVMTWSLWNGCYEAQPVVMKWYHGTQNWEILTLNFDDGTSVRMINQHGFFDIDENTYAYIKPGNVEEYIGHRFIKQNADGTNNGVILTSYSLSEETVGCYSLQTAYNENFMVEDMLSMTGEDYDGRFEYFEIGDGMKYDGEKMQTDIERYGLYTYEEFSDYLTPIQFELFNGKYFKVLVGKGVFTYDDILNIIKDNLG